MTNKLKKLLKITTTVLAISIFLWSCEKDVPLQQEIEQTQSRLNIELTSWNHFENSKNKIARKISAYKKNNLSQRTVESSEDSFYIDDSKVQIIENDNFTTYTFFVIRENPESNILENYTYKAYNDDTYEQYLLKYHYTEDDEGNKTYDTTLLDVEVIEDESILFSRVGCVPEFIQVLDDIVCTQNTVCTGDGHSPGEECNCTSSPNTCDPAGSMSCELQYVWVYQGCSGGSSGSGTDDNTNDNNNGNQTGGGGNTNTNDNNDQEEEEDSTPAIPMEPTVQDQILNCINGLSILGSDNQTSIDPEIFEQLNLSKFQWAEINNNLQNSGCSEEAQQEAIEELLDLYDEIHITNELEGKALCVYNKLKDLSAGFKNSIKKFDGDFTIADIKFKLDNIGTSVAVYDAYDNIIGYDRAYTSFPDANNLITISINNVPNSNNNVDSQPNLLLAQTIAHEVIHAEMFRQILDAVENNSIIGLTNQDVLDALASSEYTLLYEYFRQSQNWSHTYMAEHFRDVIARMTQEFDTGVAVPDSQQPEQLYLDLAWRGLMNNVAWDNEGDNQTAIENTINNYLTNNSNETCLD